MDFETNISLYEKIEIKTNSSLSPLDLGNLITSIEKFYNIYLFFFITEPANDKDNSLILNNEYIEVRDAIYPAYETVSTSINRINETLNNILYAFNEARELEHYLDLIDNAPEKVRLRINKIISNSPIKIEILGLGEVIKEFKEFILSLLNLKNNNKLKIQEIRKVELENFEKVLQLSQKYKLTPEMVSNASDSFSSFSNILNDLFEKDQINSISITEEDE